MRPHSCPGDRCEVCERYTDPDTRIYEVDLDGYDYGYGTPPGGEAA